MKLYTAKHIAEITGLTLDNVRVRIHRLQIQPAQRFDNKPLYDREAVERVRVNK
ncbi:MAG: hypothetical protein K9L68_13885 [Spirochaetales bacterium]|nr:hypothetical protein [Spirochaetales bacterium]